MKAMSVKLATALVAVAGAALVAACGDASGAGDGLEGLGSGTRRPGTTRTPGGDDTTSPTNPNTPPGTPPSGSTTPSPGVSNSAAKKYFNETVFPAMTGSCGGCHDSAGPGPAWFFRQDIDKTYTTMENLGYIAQGSRIVAKGVHSGGSAPALTSDQTTKFNTWVGMEMQARGNKAPVNIKEKLGQCFDQQLFNAIGLQNLRTTRRQNENANNCTGCNNAPCMTCHTSDVSTGVIIAYGNNNVPATYTFDNAKQVPFMDAFIGTNGTDITGSKKLQLKGEATAKDKPYTHPMYTVSATVQSAIDAFAADVANKYKAGQCQ
jgi:hypothetical protein